MHRKLFASRQTKPNFLRLVTMWARRVPQQIDGRIHVATWRDDIFAYCQSTAGLWFTVRCVLSVYTGGKCKCADRSISVEVVVVVDR